MLIIPGIFIFAFRVGPLSATQDGFTGGEEPWDLGSIDTT